MTFRVLLTSVGGAMSPYTIQRLRGSTRHHIDVVGVDLDPNALGRYFASAFEIVPPGNAANYADRMAEIVQKHSIDLVIPCSDEETMALSAAAEKITASGAQLAVPPASALAIMSDKLKTLRFLERIGVPGPQWRLATTTLELDDAITELRGSHLEVVVKPIRSRGSRDVYIIERDRQGIHQPPGHRECYLGIDDFGSLGLSPTSHSPLLIMEGLGAPAHDTDVLCWDGTLLNVVPRERVNPAGVPFRGGIVRDDARLVSYADAIARGLGTSWLFDIDTMTDASGEPRVIELNCRPSGSLSAAAAAGIPILDDIVSLAKGEAVARSPLPSGCLVLPYLSIAEIQTSDETGTPVAFDRMAR